MVRFHQPAPELHYNTRRYHRRRAEIIRLLGGKCVACGAQTDLEIHHKVPADKSFDISTQFSRPWGQILEELAKCEARCSECHKDAHGPQHGLTMYTHYKCRCDICRSVWSEKTKEYKKKAKERKANL